MALLASGCAWRLVPRASRGKAGRSVLKRPQAKGLQGLVAGKPTERVRKNFRVADMADLPMDLLHSVKLQREFRHQREKAWAVLEIDKERFREFQD